MGPGELGVWGQWHPQGRADSPLSTPVLVTVCLLGLCCSLRCALGPSEPELRFRKPQASGLQKKSLFSVSPRAGVGVGGLCPLEGRKRAHRTLGLGSPSLCPRLPGTWGGAVALAGPQACPPQHSSSPRRGRDSKPIPSEQPPPRPCWGPLPLSPQAPQDPRAGGSPTRKSP